MPSVYVQGAVRGALPCIVNGFSSPRRPFCLQRCFPCMQPKENCGTDQNNLNAELPPTPMPAKSPRVASLRVPRTLHGTAEKCPPPVDQPQSACNPPDVRDGDATCMSLAASGPVDHSGAVERRMQDRPRLNPPDTTSALSTTTAQVHLTAHRSKGMPRREGAHPLSERPWVRVNRQPPRARSMVRGRSAVRAASCKPEELSIEQVTQLASRARGHVHAALEAPAVQGTGGHASAETHSRTEDKQPSSAVEVQHLPARAALPPRRENVCCLVASLPLRFDPSSRQPVVELASWDERDARAWLTPLRLEVTAAEEAATLLDNPLCNGMLLHDLARTLCWLQSPSTVPVACKPPRSLADARQVLHTAMHLLTSPGMTADAHSGERQPPTGRCASAVHHNQQLGSFLPLLPHSISALEVLCSAASAPGASNLDACRTPAAPKPLPVERPVGPDHDTRLEAVVEGILQGRVQLVWAVVAHVRVQCMPTLIGPLVVSTGLSSPPRMPVLQHTWRLSQPGYCTASMHRLEASVTAWMASRANGAQADTFSELLPALVDGSLLARIAAGLTGERVPGLSARPVTLQASRSNLEKCGAHSRRLLSVNAYQPAPTCTTCCHCFTAVGSMQGVQSLACSSEPQPSDAVYLFDVRGRRRARGSATAARRHAPMCGRAATARPSALSLRLHNCVCSSGTQLCS